MIPQFELEFQKADSLLRLFEEIHNYIYANDGLSPQQTLEEMLKVLFIKVVDENTGANLFCINSDELGQSKSQQKTDTFSKRINTLFEKAKSEFADVFDSDEKIRLSLNALIFTVSKLQTISLTESSNDAKGLAFQKFLASRDKEGRGQFFTPEPIIDFCVEIIQPMPHERILDPACGSGGFLFSALRSIQRNFPDTRAASIIGDQLFGLDINKSIAKIARMKLLLEANSRVNIFWANSLETDIASVKALLNSSSKTASQPVGFDLVLTNPPFGTVGKITSQAILAQYDLAHRWIHKEGQFHRTKDILNGQVTEILFIERCLALLREGGRMGIVLPNGYFENSSLEYVRNYIKQKARILAIVHLPQETFIPFGTGVKTSLLFLEKATIHQKTPYKIFFSRVNKLGYQGNKNGTPLYQKDRLGNLKRDLRGAPLLDEDFPAIVEEYRQFQRNEFTTAGHSFSVAFDELNGRFDYQVYAPENRQLIDLLKRKGSARLCDLAEIVKTKSKKLSQSFADVDYVELSDINTHAFEIINSTNYAIHELPSRASYEIKTGDIITAVAGNSVGSTKHATAFVTEEFDGSICTNGFRVLRDIKISPYYLLYFFKSDFFLKQMFMYRTGAAIPSVSDADFANILIYLPDKTILEEISRRMKRAFELRSRSRKELAGINLVIA
jgi:type I restriction enzyme M protein